MAGHKLFVFGSLLSRLASANVADDVQVDRNPPQKIPDGRASTLQPQSRPGEGKSGEAKQIKIPAGIKCSTDDAGNLDHQITTFGRNPDAAVPIAAPIGG